MKKIGTVATAFVLLSTGSAWSAEDAKNTTEVNVPSDVSDQPSRARLWGSVGPATVRSNENYLGTRIAGGLEAVVDSDRRIVLGLLANSPLSSERSIGMAKGRISRLNFEAAAGYYLVPETLSLQAIGGISAISGENRDFYGKIKPTAGAVLAWRRPFGKSTDWGLALSYEYTAEARTSILTATPASPDIWCSLGDSITGTHDANCTNTGVAPAAHVVALSAIFGFGL